MATPELGGKLNGRDGHFTELRTLRFELDRFSDLPRKVGAGTSSEPIEHAGFPWVLHVYPGGMNTDADGYMSVVFGLNDPPVDGVVTRSRMRLVNSNHTVSKQKTWQTSRHAPMNSDQGVFPLYGWIQCAVRVAILDERNGWISAAQPDTVVIEVDVQVCVKDTTVWAPRLAPADSAIVRDQLRLLESGDGADVTFEVGGESVRAHRQFLLARAPALAALCSDTGDEPTPIPDASPALFKEVLRFVYTDGISVDVVQREGTALLKLADRLGCSRLKVAVECKLASSSLTVESVADRLLFAEAHCCPQLKERAMDFFVENAIAVMATPGWTRLSESAALLAELMGAMASGSAVVKKRPAPGTDVKQMRVSEIRKALDEANLDVDGSRLTLEQRLLDQMSGGRDNEGPSGPRRA